LTFSRSLALARSLARSLAFIRCSSFPIRYLTFARSFFLYSSFVIRPSSSFARARSLARFDCYSTFVIRPSYIAAYCSSAAHIAACSSSAASIAACCSSAAYIAAYCSCAAYSAAYIALFMSRRANSLHSLLVQCRLHRLLQCHLPAPVPPSAPPAPTPPSAPVSSPAKPTSNTAAREVRRFQIFKFILSRTSLHIVFSLFSPVSTNTVDRACICLALFMSRRAHSLSLSSLGAPVNRECHV
jgi:hypothetical protein